MCYLKLKLLSLLCFRPWGRPVPHRRVEPNCLEDPACCWSPPARNVNYWLKTDKSFFTFQHFHRRLSLSLSLGCSSRRDGNTSWTNFKPSAVIKVLENLPPLSDPLIGQDAGHTGDLLRVQQTYRGSVHHEGRRLHPPWAVSQVGKLCQIKEWEVFLQSSKNIYSYPPSKLFGRDPFPALSLLLPR